MRPRRGPERPPEEPRTRVNDSIRVPQVRLIGADGEQIGIKSRDEALEYAWNLNLDLVEVAADARPPVCRVMDYSKYKYEQEQKAKLARRHQNVIVIKEIKLRPKVGQHDYETKRGHVLRFLKNRDKVKVTIMFRGRETTHPERGQMLLLRLAEDVKELATIEAQPLLDGRNMTMLLAPLRKPDADEPEDEPVEVVGPAPRQRRQARIEASSGSATAVAEPETETEDETGIEDEAGVEIEDEDATPNDAASLSSTNGSQEDAPATAATEGEAEESESSAAAPEVVAPEAVAPEAVVPEVPKPRRTARTATTTASTPAPTPRAKAAPRRKAPSTTSTTTEAEPPSTPA